MHFHKLCISTNYAFPQIMYFHKLCISTNYAFSQIMNFHNNSSHAENVHTQSAKIQHYQYHIMHAYSNRKLSNYHFVTSMHSGLLLFSTKVEVL